MQAESIRRPMGRFTLFAVLAVLLSACIGFMGDFYSDPGPRLGPPKPQLTPRKAALVEAGGLYRVAKVHIQKAHYRQAERALKGSIRLFKNVLGPGASQLVCPMSNLANVYIYTGKFDKAKRFVSRAQNKDAVLQNLSGIGICVAKFPLRTSDPENWEASRLAFFTEFGRQYTGSYCYRVKRNDMLELRGESCASDAFRMSLSDYKNWLASRTTFKAEFERNQRATK